MSDPKSHNEVSREVAGDASAENDELTTCVGLLYFDTVMRGRGQRPVCLGYRNTKRYPLPQQIRAVRDEAGASERARERRPLRRRVDVRCRLRLATGPCVSQPRSRTCR